MMKKYKKIFLQEEKIEEDFVRKLKGLSTSSVCDLVHIRHPLENVKRTMPKKKLLEILAMPRWFPNDEELK